jgi:hypothetical protein
MINYHQYERMSFGDRQMMMDGGVALRNVVTQASVNNAKLRQMNNQNQVKWIWQMWDRFYLGN